MRLFHNFYISYFTFIYIIIALFLNNIQTILFGFIITFIHEVGHILTAKFYGLKIERVTLLPFGFFASINDLDKICGYKQFFIYISGPFTFIISLFLAEFLMNLNILSLIGYRNFMHINNLVLIINLLPIYPLDGGRIFDLFLSYYFDELLLRKLIIFTNTIFSIILLNLFGKKGIFIVIMYILIYIVKSILDFKKRFILFLIKRRIIHIKRPVKINDKVKLIRQKENFYLKNGVLYNEQYIMQFKENSLKRK